jgi:hypothetical protein
MKCGLFVNTCTLHGFNLTLMHVSSSTIMPYHGRTNGKFMTIEAVHLETFKGICAFNYTTAQHTFFNSQTDMFVIGC